MKKRILSIALAILMLAAMVPFTATPALAAAPTEPSFTVKHEMTVYDGTTLLFSEEPSQVLRGDQYWQGMAYILPAGTKIAQKMDGVLVLLSVLGETPLQENTEHQSYGNEVYEITLTTAMSADKNGVRICGSGRMRGLLTVFVDGETSTYQDQAEAGDPAVDDAVVDTSVGDFIIKNGALVEYTGPGGAVVIPDGVLELASGVFNGNQNIVSVVIPDSVTTIGDWAFNGCTNLTDVTLGNGVKEIGTGAIRYTGITNITLPDGLRVIGQGAFQSSKLTGITFPDSLITIGSGAFGCDELTDINIGRNVTNIEYAAFYGDKIESINVDPANQYFQSIDGVLYKKSQSGAPSILYQYPAGRGGAFTIPDGVTEIWRYAFNASWKLTSVTIPDSVTAIPYGGFHNCSGLTSITIPKNLKSIGNAAFWGCHNLTNITIPESVTEITGEGNSVFKIYDRDAKPKMLYVKAGSYAETYAKENNIRFSTGTPFDSAAEWARADIQNAVVKGFVPGDIQNEYTAVITRAEFCRMAVNYVEYKTGKTINAILADKGVTRDSDAFSDTDDPAILAAYALGITNGTGNGTFTPNGQFSREQAATMIMNTCKVIGMATDTSSQSGFADADTASAWAVDGINFVKANGIMSGTGNNAFSPKGTYTRQESIVTFDRIK